MDCVTLFALVHGGAHGGWCWEQLVPELEARGHDTVTPDLPFDEVSGAEAWARTVAEAIDAVTDGDDVVVVGHSLAGLCLPVIPSLRSVRRLVFLAAQVPVPGEVYADHVAENPDAITFQFLAGEEAAGPSGVSWEAAHNGFYHDIDEETARRAYDRLRGGSTPVYQERCPIERWPDVPSTYILMKDDRSVGQTWSRRAAARIGADLVEMPGGHSPFYACPGELADVLVALSL